MLVLVVNISKVFEVKKKTLFNHPLFCLKFIKLKSRK